MPTPPEHLTWALRLLDIKPSERILEIGCGNGLAASLIGARLSRGKLLAIDRSASQIRSAEARNRAQVEAGRSEFRRASLAECDLGSLRFDRMLAVNVNLFWLNPAEELAKIRNHLAPEGRLVLVFRPPSAGKAEVIAAKGAGYLRDGGFRKIRADFREVPGSRAVALRASA